MPSLIPLTSTTSAYKHLLASHAPHKLNGSHKARHRIMFSYRQQVTAALNTRAAITHAHAPHGLAGAFVLPDRGLQPSP